jgi:hypothetical protein
MVFYTVLEKKDQFPQYTYDDIQQFHFVHEYKVNNDEYQWFERK